MGHSFLSNPARVRVPVGDSEEGHSSSKANAPILLFVDQCHAWADATEMFWQRHHAWGWIFLIFQSFRNSSVSPLLWWAYRPSERSDYGHFRQAEEHFLVHLLAVWEARMAIHEHHRPSANGPRYVNAAEKRWWFSKGILTALIQVKDLW